MTKDRRLGRGLAALLGSPIEEGSQIESMAKPVATTSAAMPTASTGTASQTASTSTTRSRSTSSAAIDNPASATQPLAADESTATQREKTTERQSVTGVIPLSSVGSATSTTRTLELSVYEIDNNPFQPRRKFNPEEISSLAASIREHEQLQPILVRSVGTRYQLISGERRLRAAIHAGLKTIRAEVREADDRLVAELAIVENLQRKDLDAIEKAMSFRRYIDQHQCTQEDLAKRLKIDRSTIANLMRMLELPDEVQLLVQNDSITAGHARALLPLGDEQHQLEFAKLICAESWSVRETERRVAERVSSEDCTPIISTGYTRPSRKKTSPQISALEQQMRASLGTKTEIRQFVNGHGKITITFASAAEFERLCKVICPDLDSRRAA